MIPKIVHQFWLGNEAKPEIVESSLRSVRDAADSTIYAYRLYTDKDVIQYLPLLKKMSINKLHPVFISDFLRLIVLYLYGGLYIDADAEVNRKGEFGSLFTREIIGVKEKTPIDANNYLMTALPRAEWVFSAIKRGVSIHPSRNSCFRFGWEATSLLAREKYSSLVIDPMDLPVVHHKTYTWKGARQTQ